jgi:usherin
MHVVGVIIFYELWLREVGSSDAPKVVFNPSGQYDPLGFLKTLPPPATTYTVTNLSPFTEYDLRVVSQNQAGKVASDWTRSRTAEAGKFRTM